MARCPATGMTLFVGPPSEVAIGGPEQAPSNASEKGGEGGGSSVLSARAPVTGGTIDSENPLEIAARRGNVGEGKFPMCTK